MYFQRGKELSLHLPEERKPVLFLNTSEGRIDLVLQTDKFIYIMEFKLNGTAEDALQQINDKNYALPFEMDGRKLFKIGVNFTAETRNIEKWIVETKN